MRRGQGSTRKLVLLAVSSFSLLCALTPAPLRAEGSAGLDALLKEFSRVPGLSARFREEKRIALLRQPLVNEGTIHFAPPRTMARHVLSPTVSTLLIEGETMTVADRASRRTLDLRKEPLLASFVEAFLGVVSGERKALERHYRLSFERLATGWALRLQPKGAAAQRAIVAITLEGNGVELRRLRVEERSGDTSETLFRDVDARHRYGRAERKRVFRIPF